MRYCVIQPLMRWPERRVQIDLLRILIPVQQYREIRVKFMEVKAKQRSWHEKVTKLRDRNKPAHDLLSLVMLRCVGLMCSLQLQKVREDPSSTCNHSWSKKGGGQIKIHQDEAQSRQQWETGNSYTSLDETVFDPLLRKRMLMIWQQSYSDYSRRRENE